jgi:hypothetical protein
VDTTPRSTAKPSCRRAPKVPNLGWLCHPRHVPAPTPCTPSHPVFRCYLVLCRLAERYGRLQPPPVGLAVARREFECVVPESEMMAALRDGRGLRMWLNTASSTLTRQWRAPLKRLSPTTAQRGVQTMLVLGWVQDHRPLGYVFATDPIFIDPGAPAFFFTQDDLLRGYGMSDSLAGDDYPAGPPTGHSPLYSWRFAGLPRPPAKGGMPTRRWSEESDHYHPLHRTRRGRPKPS